MDPSMINVKILEGENGVLTCPLKKDDFHIQWLKVIKNIYRISLSRKLFEKLVIPPILVLK